VEALRRWHQKAISQAVLKYRQLASDSRHQLLLKLAQWQRYKEVGQWHSNGK